MICLLFIFYSIFITASFYSAQWWGSQNSNLFIWEPRESFTSTVGKALCSPTISHLPFSPTCIYLTSFSGLISNSNQVFQCLPVPIPFLSMTETWIHEISQPGVKHLHGLSSWSSHISSTAVVSIRECEAFIKGLTSAQLEFYKWSLPGFHGFSSLEKYMCFISLVILM